jgi:ferredoxin, 2Fe-2S
VSRIVFIANGVSNQIDAEAGSNLCQVAIDHFVPGIEATCGGCCSCATCHVYVDPAWTERLPAASEDERLLLSGLTSVRPESRLLCQLDVTERIDGLVMEVAPAD